MHPSFSLTIGSLETSGDDPRAAPALLEVKRDLDVPADALRVRLGEPADVALDDAVRLSLGYDGDEQAVFTGVVVSLRPGIAGAEVWALGGLHALLDVHAGATYQIQSAGAIARDLFSRAGVTPGTVDTGPLLPSFAVDGRASAHTHLQALAERLGFALYADSGGKGMFHALGGAASLDGLGAAGALAAGGGVGGVGFTYGRDVLALSVRDAPAPWAAVKVGGESPMSGQGDHTGSWLTVDDGDYRGSAGSGEPSLLVIDPAARTKDLADRFAAGRLAGAKARAREARLTVGGRPELELGDSITISGHPDPRAGGTGYLRGLRHRFGPDTGFLTDVRVTLP
ncbi:MAG TPA: hypothetical protein VI300_21155 [Solirubrobacter sp.]